MRNYDAVGNLRVSLTPPNRLSLESFAAKILGGGGSAWLFLAGEGKYLAGGGGGGFRKVEKSGKIQYTFWRLSPGRVEWFYNWFFKEAVLL